MRQQPRWAVCAAVFLSACGGASQSGSTPASASASDPGGRYSKSWVLVTLDSAQVAAQTSAAAGWDSADTTPTVKDTAENLASLLSFASQEAGMVAQALASLIPQAQPDADVTLPDVRVTITHNEAVANRQVRSPRVPDSLSPTWGYAFFARIDNLRDRGIDLEAVDDDDARADRIGMVNVPRSLLQQVADSGVSQTLSLSDGALSNLTVRVEPVLKDAPPSTHRFDLPLREGLIATHISVPRGAVVTVRSSGEGKAGGGGFLGLGCPTDVTPAGLPGGVCRNHNLSGMPALQSSAHGSAVALIGTAPEVQAVSLADGDSPTPCVTFAAPASGELVLATNDRDSSDNEGVFHFELQVSAPPEPPTEVSESPTRCQ